MSFYYWKSDVHLNNFEQQALAYNGVKKLYIRYCDIDYSKDDNEPKPAALNALDSTLHSYEIVPVVFIKNRSFEQLDNEGAKRLALSAFVFIQSINKAVGVTTKEIQFDCDWTEATKEKYFIFLKEYKERSKQPVSCTIRLHQIKYPKQTGVPPVDYGSLMYYNMGSINAGPQNSIYESSIAAKYNTFIRDYPLTLDVALPIFSWGQKIHEGKVVQLLNKIYFSHFENDSNFKLVRDDWFSVLNPGFKAEYYFAKDDAVKIERISGSDLLQMADEINRNSNNKIRNIIFYDLDSSNLHQYEKDIFKKVLDRFN